MAHSAQRGHFVVFISSLAKVFLGRTCCWAPASACWGSRDGEGGPDLCDSCLRMERRKCQCMKRDFERSITSSANIFFGSALHEQVRTQKSHVILEDGWACWGTAPFGMGGRALLPLLGGKRGVGRVAGSTGSDSILLCPCTVLAFPPTPL